MPTQTAQLTGTLNKTAVAFVLIGAVAIVAMAFFSFSNVKPSVRLSGAGSVGEVPVVEVPKTVSNLP